MDDKNTFTMMDEQGNMITCHVLFTFESEETGKTYMVYTDNTKDATGNTQVYAGTMDKDTDTTKPFQLGTIESEKEWKVIENILSVLQEEVQKQNKQEESGE